MNASDVVRAVSESGGMTYDELRGAFHGVSPDEYARTVVQALRSGAITIRAGKYVPSSGEPQEDIIIGSPVRYTYKLNPDGSRGELLQAEYIEEEK